MSGGLSKIFVNMKEQSYDEVAFFMALGMLRKCECGINGGTGGSGRGWWEGGEIMRKRETRRGNMAGEI